MSSLKINSTKNYRLFSRSEENRSTNCGRRKRLRATMKEYGFLPYFPVVARRENGKLIVKDGQHRLEMAETLGLPVHWVEAVEDFDVAALNSTAEPWRLKDYADKFSLSGIASYTEGLEFMKTHSLPIGIAFALLGGTTTFGNVQSQFIAGTFKIKDRQYAEAVASIYSPLVALSSDIKNARCLQACMMVCRVKEFDASRLLHNATKCRDKLVAYSTREAYLAMFEEVYNYGRSKLCGLKTAAIQVMRNRNATVASVRAKAKKKSAA